MTIVLFATGVVLLAIPQRGTVLLLHKASFVVWFAAMTIHVLTYAPHAARSVLADLARRRADGRLIRVALAVLALGVGIGVALPTYRLGVPWEHLRRGLRVPC